MLSPGCTSVCPCSATASSIEACCWSS
ncbi:hypothetical protein R2601_03533 [Salipiger bermudensis HTCC2601]|uniref:Uncharacterized protein n=1 Tax=Salipiger bermudensis (strain DSM 26914 / JCM 13377 / KCTC 12554 / HTCC2601) TaxID=314265 RepID=Q0FWD9_SALBH|nr:hypothetical protein R2601_03533 [Salipiger bermudensis HTCC2601]